MKAFRRIIEISFWETVIILAIATIFRITAGSTIDFFAGPQTLPVYGVGHYALLALATFVGIVIYNTVRNWRQKHPKL